MAAALIASFDELDEAHGERIGAPDDSISAVVHSLGNHLIAIRSDTPEALAWKVRRLTRAIQNDWHESEIVVIANSIARDLSAPAT